MSGYDASPETHPEFARQLLEEFHFSPRPDAQTFGDGAVFDLGGGTRVEAVHLPGHTAGHSGFRCGEVFYCSDVDLTGFGPYYGDLWSDLDQFQESLVRLRDEDARWYVTRTRRASSKDARPSGRCSTATRP
ncbi:MAG: MBL fold metallo-hydrolase [Ilumatobacteraceae bacterium]